MGKGSPRTKRRDARSPAPERVSRSSSSKTPLLAPVPMGMDEPLHVPTLVRQVSELMPEVAPVSSLTDSYSNFQYTAESSSEAGRTHAATWDAKSGITDATTFSLPAHMCQPVTHKTTITTQTTTTTQTTHAGPPQQNNGFLHKPHGMETRAAGEHEVCCPPPD